MERTEPSLVPEWLKGASGSALVSPQPAFYQVSSERRRSHGSSAVDRTKTDRENKSPVRSNSSVTRCNSFKQGVPSKTPEEQEARERDWVQDGDRFTWSKDMEGLTNTISEDRRKERDLVENGRTWPLVPGKLGNYDTDTKLRRPQPLGLSPKLSDNNTWKQIEGVSVSVPVTSASTQKSAFERDFPSLGPDDKASIISPIASPRPIWQTPLRSDLGRASSPGLMANVGSSPISSSINVGSGGTDLWNSVLVGTHSLNENTQSTNFGKSPITCSSSNPSYIVGPVSVPATNMSALNMAEALSQPPPRVRTPPQSSIESQRLEELALKQSRQLIPMTPSLPKTMSLSDKGKSKTSRVVDASRPSSSPKPDMVKHSQGKLLILKTSKDGVLSTTALKVDGSMGTQPLPHGSSNTGGLSVLSTSGSAQHTKAHTRRNLQLGNGNNDGPIGVRGKDLLEDRRSSSQMQNRNDFFNTLRKKAASTDRNSTFTKPDLQSKDCEEESREATVLGKAPSDHILHKELDVDQQTKPLVTDTVYIDCHRLPMECPDEVVSIDSEEEEAAFMRSLGWEENAEDSELTEEEINAFYQMRERRKTLTHEAGEVGVELSEDSSDI